MSAGTFSERIDELRTSTASRDGWLRGSVTVDQVYAHYQHERLDLKHPRGGTAKYLERPLMERYPAYLAELAHHVLDPADTLVHAMARNMENLSDAVEATAPREFGDLRRSGHPKVTAGGRTVYDRAPRVGRLSAADLRIKSRIRYMSLPDALKGWIWWHVQHHTRPPGRHG